MLAAFGLRGRPTPLAGGAGATWQVDDVVVKPVDDVHEAVWTQALLDRVERCGFEIAMPVATLDAGWVHDGWTASRYVSDLRAAAPAWDTIIEAGLRFGDAADDARDGGGLDVLSQRRHRWAVADRVAWGEEDVTLSPDAAELVEQISLWLATPVRDEHFVHADLSGNVFVDRAGTPVILDVSPCLRPREWAAAIVVADAVVWCGADLGVARTFTTDGARRDLFARALIFRMVAEQLADDAHLRAPLTPYRKVLSALG